MGPHSKSKEGLTCLERRQVVTHAYTLETFAHILHETCLLECVHAQCEIDGKVRIMEILDEMDGRVERRISFRIFLSSEQQVHFPICIVGIVSFDAQACRQHPVVSP